ncbi:MAG: TraY domain-containing protein [Terracidiphilus sp.]|jgi:plasmid stability protein
MAQILIRQLDERVKARLQRQAKRNGRSMEAEAREILNDVLREKAAQQYGLGTEISEMFRRIGLREGEEIREIGGLRMEIPDFEP